jgi:arginine deiminase
VLRGLRPEELADVYLGGLRNDEVRGGRGRRHPMLGPDDFVVDPLPNLLFTRDSSVWVGDRVASPAGDAGPHSARPADRADLPPPPALRRHPRSTAGTLEHVEGGDVLLLAPGVIAVGVGERTTPAGVERARARGVRAGLAHTVLAVPIAQERATMHLDTVCTMVDVDKVVMYPNVADTLRRLRRHRRRRRGGRRGWTSPTPSRSWSRPPRRWASTRCARSTPASTRSPPSASSGTTATTRWRSRPGSGGLRAQRRDQRRLEEPASRSSHRRLGARGQGRGGPRCMSCPVAAHWRH